MAGHFPSWSRKSYMHWNELLDVFTHSAVFLEDPLCDEQGAVPKKLSLQVGVSCAQGWGRGKTMVRKGLFWMVTSELCPERRTGAHLVRRQRVWNSNKLSRCFCSFRQRERRAARSPLLRRMDVTREQGKLLRPTRKELHLHFQVIKNRVYQARFLGNGKSQARDEMLSQSPSSSFIHKPRPPWCSACTLLRFSKSSGNDIYGPFFTLN